jgi:putative tricarboxylic transport membrane protein
MSTSPTTILTKEYLLCRDRVGALIFLIVCLCYGYQATQITLIPGDEYEPFTARTLPIILSYIGSALAVMLLASGQPDKQSGAVIAFNWKLLFGFFALMGLYGIGLTYLGFIIATSLFLMGGFYLLGERRKSILFGASFPFVISFYLLLTQGLEIYLEPGVIFTLF